MERLNDRLTTVLLAMVLGMTLLSVLCYATIFVQPNIPFNPLSPQRATEAAEKALAALPPPVPPAPATLDQTYPPTWTPSPTRTPGPTKTATDTRTLQRAVFAAAHKNIRTGPIYRIRCALNIW